MNLSLTRFARYLTSWHSITLARCRALKGDDGLEAQEKAKLKERARLGAVKRKWAEKRGKWSRPGAPSVVRVHPAMTLFDVLTDDRFVVANFIPSFILLPEEHESHKKFVNERNVVGLLAPKGE